MPKHLNSNTTSLPVRGGMSIVANSILSSAVFSPAPVGSGKTLTSSQLLYAMMKQKSPPLIKLQPAIKEQPQPPKRKGSFADSLLARFNHYQLGK